MTEDKEEKIEIIVNDGFAAVFHTFIDDERKTAYDLAVYVVLKRFANYNTGECFPSLKTISERAGIARSTVQKAIDHLIELGYVQKKSSKGFNTSCTYTVSNTAYRETVCSVPPDGKQAYRETVPNEIHLNDNHIKEEEKTPPVKTLEEDIKDRMRNTLGNKSFTVTAANRAFLTEKLKHHSEKMLYSLFFTWSEKATAKQRTDLHFFTVNFNTLLAAEREKPAIAAPREITLCPYCKRRLIDGECSNPFCETNKDSLVPTDKALDLFAEMKEKLNIKTAIPA